ncbi:IPT/TIG domain-containing protein [Pyxidicoccus sp. 3LFB2]
MADELNEVQPGDLITARLINAIIRLLKELEQRFGGPLTIPNVFGETLASAKTILSSATPPVTLGQNVLDANGLPVSPNDPVNQNRRVIGQVPPAGTRAPAGTAVSLLIASQPSTGPSPVPVPEITGFLPMTASVGEELQIAGKNFASLPANNVVTFNGMALQRPPLDKSTNYSLFVIVPANIPNGPAPGTPAVPVTVRVKLATTGQETGGTVSVGPATGIVRPTVTSHSPTTPFAGTDLTINGTGFGTTAAAVKVKFDDSPAGGQAIRTLASPTQLIVPIPTNLPGLGSGTNVSYFLKVIVNNVESQESISITIRPPLS